MKINKLLKLYMDSEGIGLRGLGQELGCSAATISRLMSGKGSSQDLFVNIFNWLFTDKKIKQFEGVDPLIEVYAIKPLIGSESSLPQSWEFLTREKVNELVEAVNQIRLSSPPVKNSHKD